MVTEVSGFQMTGGSEMGSYFDTQQAGVQLRPRAQYEDLRGFMEGQAVITFGETVVDCAMFYSNPGFAKAMRVTRFMALPPTDEAMLKHANSITKLRDLLVSKSWTAERADVAIETPEEIEALAEGFRKFKNATPIEQGIASIVEVHAINNKIEAAEAAPATTDKTTAPIAAAQPVQTQETPPPLPPPTGTEKPTEQTTEQPKESGGGPMGFFSKAPGDNDKTAPPPPAKGSEAQSPQSWEQIASEDTPSSTPPSVSPSTQATPPPQAEPQQQPTAQPATATPEKPQSKKATLPKEIEEIIKAAAQNTKKAIFKGDEDIDASE